MTWHKVNWNDRNTVPKNSGTYLCRILTAGNHGHENVTYRTIRFNCGYDFSCDSMIVTHWAEDFNKPEDVQL